MKISYNGLWKELIDQGLQKKNLIYDLGISSSTVAKMSKGENVSLEVLARICVFLNCDLGDIVCFVSEESNAHE